MESFSAFVETGLLLLTALYIIWEAFQRLLFHSVHIRPSLTAILVLALCMGVDFVRSRALKRVAKKYPSEALEADALHFSTDVWSTLVVILGITGAWLGMKFGIPWLGMLDAVAALGVAGVIIWIGSRLGKRTVDALMDVAPHGLRERIASAVGETEGVLQTERVRVRRAGQRYFVDVTISVPRTASLEQAHAASDAVERSIGKIVPADVVVHVEPRARSNEHSFRNYSRHRAAPRTRRSRTIGAPSGRPAFRRAASGSGRAGQSARGAPPGHASSRTTFARPPDAGRGGEYSHRAAGRAHSRRGGDEGTGARGAGFSEFASRRNTAN